MVYFNAKLIYNKKHIFTKQIEQASEKNKRKNIIILGDANLDINK